MVSRWTFMIMMLSLLGGIAWWANHLSQPMLIEGGRAPATANSIREEIQQSPAQTLTSKDDLVIEAI